MWAAFRTRKRRTRGSWLKGLAEERRRQPTRRDDAGYFSAFLAAKTRLGDLCAYDAGGGAWRPCPMARCDRPDHDHVLASAEVSVAADPASAQQASVTSSS